MSMILTETFTKIVKGPCIGEVGHRPSSFRRSRKSETEANGQNSQVIKVPQRKVENGGKSCV